MRSIVRGLKTFSRADEEQRVPLDLVRVIDLAINMAWNEIRHRARVVKDFGAVPLVEADETRLAQVFINLLVNAAHALPEGNADANQIRVVTSTDARGRAVIKLSDTGQGIRPEQLSRIFDPFFTTKPVGVGTGLGLSICHGIVTGLGGDISAQSQVGVGTTFTIVLPAALELASAPEARRATTAPPSTGRRGRVLIVDDDAAVAATLKRALSKEHDVVVVHEGRAALDLFRAGECYDVFFCDLMMPVVTGMEVHAELSKISPAQVENMVIITGGAFSKQAREFLDAVPNERIDKPFGIQNVRALVRRMVH